MIPRRDRRAPSRLSFAQQRLWFLEQLAPHHGVYNVPQAVRLQGELDVAALGQALNAIVDRHEALRTTFVVEDQEPAQVVGERRAVQLPVTDLGAVPEEVRAGELARVLRFESERPFDLSRDLMLRALLVRLAADDHVLLLIVHHIVSDGWSLEVLTRELGHFYAAYHEGPAAGLAPLPIQYADYAAWQRAALADGALHTQLAYWKAHLAGMPPTLQLPTDRPRPAVQTYRGARESVVLPRDLSDALSALSRRERVTLFMTLVAAFQAVLHGYTGTDDVVVGTAIAGRERLETEDLIGLFVNTLVLRTDLAGDPAFTDLLVRVRDTMLAAYENQGLPFEKLVEELHPTRSLGWMPLVQVFFVLQDHQQPLSLPGLTATAMEVDTATAKFDVSVSVQPGSRGLQVTANFNTDLYGTGTIRRMLGHYETLLRDVAAHPGRQLSALPLLTEAESHQLLTAWNATQTAFPQAACIHELIEAQTARTPDAVAVTDTEGALSYRQLDERANQLAHHLRRRGIGPNVLVGLCLERSVDLVVGLLGILKAGGAYLPLDPSDPPERLAFVLEDARLSVLVAHDRFVQRLPESPRPALVRLDADWPAIAQEPRAAPVAGTTADDLCYVIYTSGSTGKPKGALIPHRALSNLMAWRQAAFPTGSADVVLQKTPVTFDAALNELIPPLLVGARLVMARPDGQRDPRYLIDTIRAERVSRLSLVPSLLQAMLDEPDLEGCTSLRWLSCGGEALPRALLERVRARLDVQFVNLYGPTESTIDAMAWVAGQESVSDVVPIGRPIANIEAYVLDHHLRPVPIGIPGELCVGGAGLALGYLGRPDLTAERFVPNPFSGKRGARLYRTGDLARFLPDGNIEYLGRLDHQVKLRGFRIELGEIEAALRHHPDVRDAVVILRADSPENKRLVAYFVARAGAAPSGEALRRFLQRMLPEYMVPSAVMSLPAFPLTSSGKVDRNDLPVPDVLRHNGGFVEPRDAMERELAQIWEEILGVHPVGATDNFFELGGHSLLAVRAMNAIERRMGMRIPLAILFARPTIELLTQALRNAAEATRRALDELGGVTDETARQLLNEAGR